ncbi:MAG: hypothetical protein GC165_04850 [Armatimonadetes bacterium]|nr:hypothetical protein [Armatimonadota bacterium]
MPFLYLALCAATQAGHRPIKIVGNKHVLALFADGAVSAWGMYGRGEIGPIELVKKGSFLAEAPVAIGLPKKAIDIAAADGASFALLSDGTVAAWGTNISGLLGTNVAKSESPVVVPELNGIVKIAAGGMTVAAIRNDGKVFGWGRGLDRTKPAEIEGLTGIKELSIGDTHTMALDSAGSVWTFGEAMYGSLGRMEQPDKPGKVASLSGVVSIAASGGVSTAVKRDGTVWVWGSNFQGQFGNGDRSPAPVTGGLNNKIQLVPVQVPGIKNAVAVSSGIEGRHTLALMKDGSLRGWGNTDWGQLGGGVSGTFQTNVMTPKISGVRAIFAVGNHSYAIKQDGSLWAWGKGDRGSFPFSKGVSVPTPLSLK